MGDAAYSSRRRLGTIRQAGSRQRRTAGVDLVRGRAAPLCMHSPRAAEARAGRTVFCTALTSVSAANRPFQPCLSLFFTVSYSPIR